MGTRTDVFYLKGVVSVTQIDFVFFTSGTRFTKLLEISTKKYLISKRNI